MHAIFFGSQGGIYLFATKSILMSRGSAHSLYRSLSGSLWLFLTISDSLSGFVLKALARLIRLLLDSQRCSTLCSSGAGLVVQSVTCVWIFIQPVFENCEGGFQDLPCCCSGSLTKPISDQGSFFRFWQNRFLHPCFPFSFRENIDFHDWEWDEI